MRIAYKNGFKLELDISFFLALLISAASGLFTQYIFTFFAALMHEAAHILTAAALGEKTKVLKILAVGLNAEIEDRVCSGAGRIIIYCIGPLVNGLIAAGLTLVGTYYLHMTDNMRFFILINLYLAIFNMIPILPLDGGKVLREILWDRMGIYSAHAYVKKISVALAVITVLLGIAQLFFVPYNFSLLAIGLYIFFTLKSREGEVGFMNIKNVIYRRDRLMKKGIYPARDLVVMKWMNLNELIKNMDFDRFHIIYVLDEELKISATFTEKEVMDGILNNSSDITFEDLIKLQK